jgi:hypothetical protein
MSVNVRGRINESSIVIRFESAVNPKGSRGTPTHESHYLGIAGPQRHEGTGKADTK